MNLSMIFRYSQKFITTDFKRILRSEIVHINLSRPIAILSLVLLSRLCSAKVIVTVHGNFGDKAKNGENPKPGDNGENPKPHL